MEAVGLYGQTVRFDGKLLEIGPRVGCVAAYYGHPGGEARTEAAFIWLDEISKVRFRRAALGRRGRLQLIVTPRADETSQPLWWLETTDHPRIANIWFASGQQASFGALHDAIRQAISENAKA